MHSCLLLGQNCQVSLLVAVWPLAVLAAQLLDSLPFLPPKAARGTAAGRPPGLSSAHPMGSMPAVLPGAAPRHSLPRLWSFLSLQPPSPEPGVLSSLHHCSLTVWLRKVCISRCPHAFRFSSGVTSYSACRMGSREAWGLDRAVSVGKRHGGGDLHLPALGVGWGWGKVHSPPHPGRRCSVSAQASWHRTPGTAGARWAAAHTDCGSHALQAKMGAVGVTVLEPIGRVLLLTSPSPRPQWLPALQCGSHYVL